MILLTLNLRDANGVTDAPANKDNFCLSLAVPYFTSLSKWKVSVGKWL